MRLQEYLVGIYLRLSRDDNNGNSESMSIANQRQLITDYVNERGWNIAEIYIDDGCTGTTFDRPGFKKMIEDVESGKINCIVTKDLSRLGRNYSKVGYYTEEYFLEWGVRFIAINDNVDTMKDDNDIAPFKNILNEMYAKDISRKIKSARRVNAKQGKFMGSKPPYGYMRSPNDKHLLIIDEEQGKIVKRIFDMFSNGNSARYISNILNNEGVLSPRAAYYEQQNKANPLKESATWNSNTVMQLLKNRVYCGDMVQGKRRVVSYKTKNRVTVPKEDWIVIEDTHEPIIDRETWLAMNQKIESTKQSRSRKETGNVSLFAGVAKCAECGGVMVFSAKPSTSGNKVYNQYKCSKYVTHGKSVCSIHTISEEFLAQTILQDIRYHSQLLEQDEEMLVNKLLALKNVGQNADLEAAQKRLRKLEARLSDVHGMAKKLFEEKYLGNVPDKIFKPMMDGYEKEQEILELSIIKLKQEMEKISEATFDVLSWVEKLKKLTHIETLSRDIVVSLIDCIEVHESTNDNGTVCQTINVKYKFVGRKAA